MDAMTRSENAEKVGVNPETLRYYEREALIPKPRRSDGGFRLYDDSYVDWLRFIQRAKDLGFTLAEIKGLLHLRVNDEATCRDVKSQAEERLEDVEEKIRDIRHPGHTAHPRRPHTAGCGLRGGEGRRATVPSSTRWSARTALVTASPDQNEHTALLTS